MALTIADIDAKIQALLDSPQVDYTEGDVSVSASQKLDQLMKVREHLIANPEADISTVSFDLNVTEFGEDDSEFED